MRFFIDNNLSPQLADHLDAADHDAVHLRTYGMQWAPDPEVMQQQRCDLCSPSPVAQA